MILMYKIYARAVDNLLTVCVYVCSGDEEEWEQQCFWHTELTSVLNRVSVCMERLQKDHDQLSAQEVQNPVSFT